jgi:hypothetical protein
MLVVCLPYAQRSARPRHSILIDDRYGDACLTILTRASVDERDLVLRWLPGGGLSV